MRPFFQINVGGQDITSRLAGGGISLSITDGVGINSDSVQIEIDDKDGVVAPPSTGVELNIIAGYDDDRVDFGTYTVDEVSLSGWPQKISISAQAAKAKSALKQRRPKSYEPPDYPTYGKLFEEIAERNGLQLAISGEIAGKSLEYEAQAEESDFGFLSRLALKLDAAVSVKDGRLVAVKRGAGVSAGGKPLPFIRVRYGENVLSYTVSRKDQPKHKKVKATYFDRKTAKRKEVEADASDEGPEYLLRQPFQSEGEAQDAADSYASDLQRNEGSATFEIDGNPHARAEAHVLVSKIRSLVDGVWRAVTVTHNWTAGGAYSTSLECELPRAG